MSVNQNSGRFRTQLGADYAILTLSIASSILYLSKTRTTPSVSRMIIKTASIALLSVLTITRGGPKLLAIALGGGSVGDAFLAWDGDAAFLCGLGSFLVAHLFYIRLFVLTGAGLDRILAASSTTLEQDGGRWRLVVAVVLVAVFAPIMLSRLMTRVATDLRVPIVIYTTVIVCMVLAALTVEDGWVVAGALMFTSSDGILAAEKFLISSKSSHAVWMPYAVWSLYYGGQLIISFGLLP